MGDIPALLTSHPATDRRYARRGVGSLAVRRAIKVAVFLSGTVGRGAVLAKPEPDVVGFYEKPEFKKTPKTDADLADMYPDIKHLQTSGLPTASRKRFLPAGRFSGGRLCRRFARVR